ncbi:ABC transporter permease [Streptomyces sp. TRM49041]|uniref:ABC transporter permease n=1 Tax=Streptomyces sp. TRM49041 TaxID=2603216 RepID=UPI0011EE6F7A|nr:ABC transporter permease [Streptomyces sp. TRM49041]
MAQVTAAGSSPAASSPDSPSDGAHGSPGAPAAPKDGRTARRSLPRRLLARPEIGALIAAIGVYAFFFAAAPAFREAGALATVLYQASVMGIMALPVALLMIGGEFDLSAGVAVTTSALTASMVSFQLSLNVWTGVLVSLVVSLGIGAFNGYMLVRTGLPSFLITLGTFLILQGANLAVTKIFTGNVATDSISDMEGFAAAQRIFASEFGIGGIQVKVTVVWWLLFAAAATWLLLRTRFGNWIFAVGGNKESARAVGVPVNFTKIALFMGVSAGAWFVGMHLLFSFNTVQSGEGVGNEFLYIIAAVIGGCLLTGGYGSAIGPVIGAFIFGMVSQGIVYANWNPDWFKAFLGVMLLMAALVNLWVRRTATRR